MWFSTSDAINWFLKINDPFRSKFLQIDIEDYYTSINESLFNNALLYAKRKGLLSLEEMHIIKPASVSFLRYDEKLWIRSDTRDGFNIAIRSSDSAQVSHKESVFFY